MKNVVRTSDMVSVVTCKDCKYYRRYDSVTQRDTIVVWCDKHNDKNDRIDLSKLSENWFCADGERRDSH